MPPALIALSALAPGALLVAGVLGGLRAAAPRAATTLAIVAAAVALAGTAAAAAWTSVAGPTVSETLGAAGAGLSLRLDALSATVALLVAFVGLIVVRFSRNYLDGDPGQGRFMRWLCLTLAAVLALILSGNLLQLWLAWIATSLSLNRLLLFYPERPAAVLAARKKFVVSRVGDALVLAAMLLLHRAFGSLDFAALAVGAEALRAAGSTTLAVQGAAACLVGAALLKSAQFPFHGWLTEVMETPTPVSALLHAGVINAGGFLVLRLAGVISLSAPAMELMVVAGGATALFGSLVMLTQTSVKGALAASTIAQLGFMILECGLGAFSAALLHLVAHSLYKAHAFLSSGSVVDAARASPGAGTPVHPGWVTAAAAFALVATGTVAAVFSELATQPGVVVLGAVLALGVASLLAQGAAGARSPALLLRVAGAAAAVTAAYFALQVAAERLTAGALPGPAPLRGGLDAALCALVVLSFAAVTVLQEAWRRPYAGARWLALRTHLSHGLYLNTLANRAAMRLWPSPPRPASALAPVQGARP